MWWTSRFGDGLLRTIGNPEDRFGEDRLRMLRAIRFSASLGFRSIPPQVAIGQHAKAIAIVSEERVVGNAEIRLPEGDPWIEVISEHTGSICIP